MAADTPSTRPASHRPRITTVFVAAFVAGAAAAVGVNRALDLHLAQAKPQVECEPVFVALRPLPSGAPITVWDVALRDLPKAMVPATALRVTDSFEGRVLKFPLREGQPLMSGQLVQPEPAPPAAVEGPAAESPVREEPVEEAFVAPVPAQPSVATTTIEPVAEPLAVVPNQATADRGPSAHEPAEKHVDVVETDPPMPVAEPNPAAPTEAIGVQSAGEPVAAAPATVPTPSAEESPTDASVDLDMPARPPVDVSKLPSVMASDGPTAAPEETSGRTGVRYLVVPERIARQADTSFTTPPAPSAAVDAPSESQPSPEPRQPSVESQTSQTPTAKPQQVQPPKAQSRRTPQTQAQPGQTSNRQPQNVQTRSRQTSPPRTTAPAKPSEQSAADGRTAPGPRAWGGMFPNVSAGLEAFGGWRSGRTAPGQSASGSTTR